MKTRDGVVGFVDYWQERSGVTKQDLFSLIALHCERYRSWKKSYNQPVKNNHNLPKSSWLIPEEEQMIIAYARSHRGTGYRRMSYMMLDEGLACALFRLLKQSNL